MSKLFDFNGDGHRSVLESVFGLHIINSVLNQPRRGNSFPTVQSPSHSTSTTLPPCSDNIDFDEPYIEIRRDRNTAYLVLADDFGEYDDIDELDDDYDEDYDEDDDYDCDEDCDENYDENYDEDYDEYDDEYADDYDEFSCDDSF